ncbi:MAG: glycosyltransferase [Paludibacteraceae bacterium]
MKKPLVSVIMATFNEPEQFIKDSMESILKQTYSNFEFIIIDDSTNLTTIEAINSYAKDNRITIIRKKERLGFVRALNEGLKIAKGQFIARMDADDISILDRFEKQLNYFSSHQDIDILGGNIEIINEVGAPLSLRKYPSNKISLRISSIFRSPVAHPTVMFKRTIIDDHLYYDESFSKAEDTEFWFRLRNKGYKIVNLPYTLLNFRISGDLAKKRSVEHFSYNHRARYKNFSWKYFYVDIPSIVATKFYLFIPKKFISLYYSIENKKIL